MLFCLLIVEKWNEWVEKINCELMLFIVNVILKYYCFVNYWGNELVELCGEESEIIGKYIFLIFFINIVYIFF